MKQKLYLGLLLLSSLVLLSNAASAQHSANLQEGIRLFTSKNYDDAERFFLNVLKEDSENAVAAFYVGRIRLADEDFDEAIEWLDRAAKFDKTNSTYYYWLGKAYEGKLEHANIFNLRLIYSKVKSCLSKAAEIDPGNVEARYDLAKSYYQGSPIIGGSKSKAREQLD